MLRKIFMKLLTQIRIVGANQLNQIKTKKNIK